MSTAIEEPKTEVKLPKCGDQVFVYHKGQTRKCPTPGIVIEDAKSASALRVMALTVFGPFPMRSVLHHTDKRLENHELRQNGCWSWDRIDLK